ncbi:MAG: hypothetical protein WDA27_06520 [Actinomycetota bacterium]
MNEHGITLTRIVLLLIVIAAFVFEGGAVVVARVQADRLAIDAADEAGGVYARSGSTAKAEVAARDIVELGGGELANFSVSRSQLTVKVTVRKQARTFVIHRIGALRKFSVAEVTHQGEVQSS